MLMLPDGDVGGFTPLAGGHGPQRGSNAGHAGRAAPPAASAGWMPTLANVAGTRDGGDASMVQNGGADVPVPILESLLGGYLNISSLPPHLASTAIYSPLRGANGAGLNGNGGGGAGAAGNLPLGLSPDGGVTTMPAKYFCEVCGVATTSETNLRDHEKGRKHLRRAERAATAAADAATGAAEDGGVAADAKAETATTPPRPRPANATAADSGTCSRSVPLRRALSSSLSVKFEEPEDVVAKREAQSRPMSGLSSPGGAPSLSPPLSRAATPPAKGLSQLNPGEMAAIMGSLRRMPSGNLYEGFPCVRVGDYLLPSSMDLRQFLNEMQEVGELSPAASPVKSPSARAAGFAALMEEADVAARAPAGRHADAEGGQQFARQGPLQEAEESGEASTHGLRGGSAAEANGGPSHAASGELEGTEHLHSNGHPALLSTAGCGGNSHSPAPVSVAAVKATAPQHLGGQEAAVQSGVAAQQVAMVPAQPSMPAGTVDVPAEQAASSGVDILGQPANSGISQHVDILGQANGSSADRSVDILGEPAEVSADRGEVRSQAKQEAPLAGSTSGAQQKGRSGVAAEGQATAAQSSAAPAAAEEQQFTCDVCAITTSSEAHMQAHLAGKRHQRKVECGAGPQVCALCNITTTSAEHMALHLRGKAHLRKQKIAEIQARQAALGAGDSGSAAMDFSANSDMNANGSVKVVDGIAATAGAGLVYVCNLCDITATSPENLDAHFRGANHRKKLRQKELEAEGRLQAPPGAPSTAQRRGPGGSPGSAQQQAAAQRQQWLRQQQQSSQPRFRRQQAAPGHGYAPDGMLATAPYAPVGALQYPVRAPLPAVPAPTVPMTRSPAFSQGGPMDGMAMGGGGRGRGGAPMSRASQPPAQPQQQPDYGRGGGYYRDMQEYAAGQTAMANAYGLGQAAAPAFMQPEYGMPPAYAALPPPQMAMAMGPQPPDMYPGQPYMAAGPYSGGPVAMPPSHMQMQPPDNSAYHAGYGQRF